MISSRPPNSLSDFFTQHAERDAENQRVFDSKDNPFNSDSVRMMQGFYDDELCNTLAQQHGIGIAAMM